MKKGPINLAAFDPGHEHGGVVVFQDSEPVLAMTTGCIKRHYGSYSEFIDVNSISHVACEQLPMVCVNESTLKLWLDYGRIVEAAEDRILEKERRMFVPPQHWRRKFKIAKGYADGKKHAFEVASKLYGPKLVTRDTADAFLIGNLALAKWLP